MWFRSKNNVLDEDIIRRLADIEAKVQKYKQDVDSLRGLVNRKLGNYSVDSDSGKENYKSDDGLDELREIYGKEKNSPGKKKENSIG